jgi:hypothetical protein
MLVKRDCFAREELHREREYALHGHTCAWCGNVKQTARKRPYLFQYHLETDGGSKHGIMGLFCGESCRKAYHN